MLWLLVWLIECGATGSAGPRELAATLMLFASERAQDAREILDEVGKQGAHRHGVLHRQLLEIVRHDEVCCRLMTTPGVGPVVALTFRATVDVPSRFTSSKAVGAAFGLTPRRQQSGEIDRMGRISKCGDGLMRETLFEAALVLMTHTRK